MSCEWVGWCVLFSKDWANVIVGGLAATATSAAAIVAVYASRRDARRERKKNAAMRAYAWPILICEAAEIGVRARLAARAVTLQVGDHEELLAGAELEFGLGYATTHLAEGDADGRVRKAIAEIAGDFSTSAFDGMKEAILVMPSEVIDTCGGLLADIQEMKHAARMLGLIVPGHTSQASIGSRLRRAHQLAIDLMTKSEHVSVRLGELRARESRGR